MEISYRISELYNAAPRTPDEQTALLDHLGELLREYFRVTGLLAVELERNQAEATETSNAAPVAPGWVGVCWDCGAGSGTLVGIGSARVLFFLLVHGPRLAWARLVFSVRRLFRG